MKKLYPLAVLPLFLFLPPLGPGAGPEAPPTGAIEGVVTLEAAPRRRTASRYAGGRAAAVAVQEVPAVVYLAGPVEGSPPQAARTVRMVQRDSTFVPAAIVIPVGSSIEFPNDDEFYHNVFSYSSAARFDLGRYPQGESKTVAFTEPGVIDVFCEVHSRMRAAIVVTENAFHAVVDEDGSFRIEGIPPGEHTVVFWHPDMKTTEQVITVSDGGTARVEVELER